MKEYIEREAARDMMEQALVDDWEIQYADDRLDEIPAADVVEARHGRWVKVHDEVCYWLACSVCGEEIPKRFGTDYYTSYCPNCGAKMTEDHREQKE